MITDLPTYCYRYFDRFHQRTVRDILALPPEADGLAAAPRGEGEKAWNINEDRAPHCGVADCTSPAPTAGGDGSTIGPCPAPSSSRSWIPAIEASFEEFHRRLDDSPPEWLQRRVRMIDTDGMLSGWRHYDDAVRARGASPQPDRHLRRPGGVGCAAHLRPLSRESIDDLQDEQRQAWGRGNVAVGQMERGIYRGISVSGTRRPPTGSTPSHNSSSVNAPSRGAAAFFVECDIGHNLATIQS